MRFHLLGALFAFLTNFTSFFYVLTEREPTFLMSCGFIFYEVSDVINVAQYIPFDESKIAVYDVLWLYTIERLYIPSNFHCVSSGSIRATSHRHFSYPLPSPPQHPPLPVTRKPQVKVAPTCIAFSWATELYERLSCTSWWTSASSC